MKTFNTIHSHFHKQMSCVNLTFPFTVHSSQAESVNQLQDVYQVTGDVAGCRLVEHGVDDEKGLEKQKGKTQNLSIDKLFSMKLL